MKRVVGLNKAKNVKLMPMIIARPKTTVGWKTRKNVACEMSTYCPVYNILNFWSRQIFRLANINSSFGGANILIDAKFKRSIIFTHFYKY